MFVQGKESGLYNNKNLKTGSEYSWNLDRVQGHPIAWAWFWPDNVHKNVYLTTDTPYASHGSAYFRIVREVNISPDKNKKVVSFCCRVDTM